MSGISARPEERRVGGAAIHKCGATRSFESQRAKCVCRSFLLVLASLAVAGSSLALGQSLAQAASETLEGTLITAGEGRRPVLKTTKRDYTLAATSSYLLHTLQDERLTNREVRVEGTLKPDGTFEAAHFFTVRDGKLYKIRYYCSICNIAALEPGNCVCCQRPTELQEIPLSDVNKDTVVVP